MIVRSRAVRRTPAVQLARASLLVVLGCGGSEDTPPADTVPDGASDPTPAEAPGDTMPLAGPVDTAGDTGEVAPVREPGADTAPRPGDAGPPEGTEPAADDAPGTGPPADPSDDLPPWTSGPIVREAGPLARVLQAARTGRHEGFDRLVLEFEGGVPGYRIGYADAPLHQCGSGRPIDTGTPSAIQVRLDPAAAHDERGSATVSDRDLVPRHPAIRTARLTCDFEGTVEWVLGTESRFGIRAFTLESPPRLVLDVQHP